MKRFAFDLQLFASAPSAERVTCMVGKESVFGTAVTPTVSLIPSSLSFDGTNDLIERPGARGRIGQTEQLTGLFTGKGSMMVEADADTLGPILLLTCGAESFGANASNPGASAVSTTVADANGTGIGFGPMTPTAMTNIVVGQSLTIDTAGQVETVVVRATSSTQFWAYFTKTHAHLVAIANASVVLAYDHTFTLASPRLSFTTQLNEIVAGRNAFGCQMSQLGFKITPKQVIEASCQAEYQGEAHVGSPTSPAFSTLRGFVFNTPGNACTFNGVALDSAVQGVSLDINVGLVTDYPKLGNGRYRAQLAETITKVSGSLDLAFESETARQYFWGNSGATGPASQVLPVPLVLTFVSVDYINTAVQYQLVIKVPMMKIKTNPTPMKVGDYLKQTVQFTTAESTNAAGDDVKFVLTNTLNGASL